MNVKIYGKKDDKEVIVYEGEIGYTSPIIQLSDKSKFVGSMGLWVNQLHNQLHIYFPSLDLELSETLNKDE